MPRYLIPLILMCAILSAVSAQQEEIDSLRKVLPGLQDTARIDCMASIAECFLYENKLDRKEDSVIYYTTLVYNESEKINYTHGLAEAYADRSFIANVYYGNFSQAEQLAGESLKWFNLTSNKNKIALTYWQLSEAQCKQSKYDEGLINAKLCYEWAKRTADTSYQDRLTNALEAMTDIYRDRGEYDKLLAAQQELIDREKANGDHTAGYSIHELWVLGLMYMMLEDYQTALFYWRKLFSGKDNPFLGPWNRFEYAQLLTLANETDSALYYYNGFDSAIAKTGDLRIFLVSKGEYFLYLKQYKTALPYFLKGLEYNRHLNDQVQVKRTILDIAKTYAALNETDSAISYAKQGLSMAFQVKSKPSVRDGYEILYTVYDRLHQSDSAFYYYKRYITMKEAVMNEQTKGKIATYGYTHKIELLNKETQLQQQQLKSESTQKNILIAGVLTIALIGFVTLRNFQLKRNNDKLKNEKIQSELQHRSTELEIQALRSQMNPHFIFNCLTSINRFILKNETETASDYLTKFSRLIRMVLNNSKQEFISLEDEVEMLCLYLDLERLRFKNSFDYNIKFTNVNDADSVFIPPLILQPFAENAIWHGLMHKEGRGHLEIELSLDKEILNCIITDDGIGRRSAAIIQSSSAETKKSFGQQITKERLALLNHNMNGESFLNIEDINDDTGNETGTRVTLKMRYRKSTEIHT